MQTMHSGSAAVGTIDAEPLSFSAIVTNINLGEQLGGFDVARLARNLNPQVKIVFPKPFDPCELAAQVRLLVGKG